MPEQLLSDQGTNFESHVLKHLCVLLGTDKLHTSTYHAAGNGITERLNKSIKPALAKLVNATHDNWDLFLSMALSAYNNNFHSTIGMSPYEAQFGRAPVQVSDVIMSHQLPADTEPRTVADFIVHLLQSAERINLLLRDHTSSAQLKQKTYYDRFVRDKAQYAVGDSVKINNCRRHVGLSKAFEPKFLGPYTITERIGDLNYRLQSPMLRDELVHYNRMLPYHTRDKSSAAVLAPAAEQQQQQQQQPLPEQHDHREMYIVVRRSPRFIDVTTPAPAAPHIVDDAVVDELMHVRDADEQPAETYDRVDSLATSETTATDEAVPNATTTSSDGVISGSTRDTASSSIKAPATDDGSARYRLIR